MIELGLDSGDGQDELYLHRYSAKEWSSRLRERRVVNIALFSGDDHVGAPAVPPSALALLCALTGEVDGNALVAQGQGGGGGITDSSCGSVTIDEEQPVSDCCSTVTATFSWIRPQKGRGVRYFVASFVPQRDAKSWIQKHASECDLALLVFDSEGRDGCRGACSLEYLVGVGEQIVAADSSMGCAQRLFVCVDLRLEGLSVAESMGSLSSGDQGVGAVDGDAAEEAVEDGGGKGAFHAAVAYVKKTDLPQVEKFNALELGAPIDGAVKRAFCSSLEDVLSKRTPEKSTVSVFTSWLMSWLSSLWKTICWFIPASFRLLVPFYMK